MDRWARMLAGGLGNATDIVTVDYAGDATDASAAAERSLASGQRHVALIPVTGVDSAGRGPGIGDDELARLQELSATSLGQRYPHADIVLATTAREPVHRSPRSWPCSTRPMRTTRSFLASAVSRAFDGDMQRFGQFVGVLQKGVPAGTQLALRGSVIQGYSYKTLEPFDARGPGSSDLDLVLFGDDAMAAWDPEAFFIPGINTMPLGDESRWVAPSLEPARSAAQAIARRPVNIQAMARWFMDIRSGLQGQPYVILDA